MENWNLPFQHPLGQRLVIWSRLVNRISCGCVSARHTCTTSLMTRTNELVSLIRQLTSDQILFKETMKGGEWVETTLVRPQEKSESLPGHSVRFISWSGKFDK